MDKLYLPNNSAERLRLDAVKRIANVNRPIASGKHYLALRALAGSSKRQTDYYLPRHVPALPALPAVPAVPALPAFELSSVPLSPYNDEDTNIGYMNESHAYNGINNVHAFNGNNEFLYPASNSASRKFRTRRRRQRRTNKNRRK